jgi:hypothetical protein
MDATTANNWTIIYNVSMLVGFGISAVTTILICLVFPPPGLGEGVKEVVGIVDLEHTQVHEV